MQPEEPEGAKRAEPTESRHREPPLLPQPSGRARWLVVAAFLVAAAFSVWRCG